MKLVIVESPAKCKKIENYLGNEYKCVASFGHIRGLLNGLKDIDIANGFTPTFHNLKEKGKYISQLRKQIQKASEVILATDDDREGEAIAWHICKVFKLPVNTTKRIIFNEITKPALQLAIKNPVLVNMDKVNAQKARQVLDLLVGYTISPILWKHISRKMQLSAGRCQTPALRLIYDNDNLIKENPGKMVYNTELFYKELPFKLNHYFVESKNVNNFLEASKEHNHKLSSGDVKEGIKKKQPSPLTTSILQQKASNVLGYSPKRTMQVAQKLYEGGHITYMRTDSYKYSAKFLKDVKNFITKTYGEKYVGKLGRLSNKQKKTKKDNAQEAHEAIRPTHIENKKVDDQYQGLYNLIRTTTLESCSIPAIYKSIIGTIDSPMKYVYKKSEEQVVEPGWKIINGYEKENKNFAYLESLKKKQKINYEKIESMPQLKNRKLHYTEAKLVQVLEKKGIGRPSTFSNIISKIQTRGYVKKMDVEGTKLTCVTFKLVKDIIVKKDELKDFGVEKNKLVLQSTGKIVIEFLIKHFDSMFVYDYTKHMEDNLDKISQGTKTFLDLCSICYNEIIKLSNSIKMTDKQVYKIDDYHCYMIGKYGPVIRKDVDGETSFINVKKDLDIDKLREGGYKLEEIIEKSQSTNIILGKYKNNDVILKKGKFGLYVNCDGKNYSIKHIKKKINKITLEDVLEVLKGKKNSNMLMELRNDLSIRKGKYGAYIFYKTDKMNKPRFLKLKNIDWNKMEKNEILNWINNEYNI